MAKTALAVAAGLVAWIVLASIAGVILRASWPDYAAVAGSMTFTLPMLIARLTISTVTLLAAARLTAVIAPRATIAVVVLGAILVAAFVPIHIGVWDRFPVWYHLTFLLTLLPLCLIGGRLGAATESNRVSRVRRAAIDAYRLFGASRRLDGQPDEESAAFPDD